MRRVARPLTLLVAYLALFLLGWTTHFGWTTHTPWTFPRLSALVPDREAASPEAWAMDQLAGMTLQQKVSQLFSSYAYGYFRSVDDPSYQRLVDLVERFEVGGLIFFQGEPINQAALINDLQQRAAQPLLISQDMEWGAGMRIDHTTMLPRTMALGATRTPAYAYAAGYITAQEARALGTHQIFAPVADVNNNPHNPIINVRSFAERPDLVAEMVGAFVRGTQDGGAIATAKHFPGHGDTDVDSHADLPVLPFGRTRLDTLELVPFRAAIEAGVGSIMTGHLAFPEVEPNPALPATLSPRVSTGILRSDLGFRGLIVTDALNMHGVTKHYGTGEAAVRALEAGADVLLMSEDEYAARAAVLQAIRQGRLSEARIEASARRILEAKARLGLQRERLVDLGAVRSRVATSDHAATSLSIARASLTLLRNQDEVLPLAGPAGVRPPNRVLVATLSDGDDPSTGRFFAKQLREHTENATITTRLLDRRSEPDDYRAVARLARRHDVVLVPAFVYVRPWTGRITLSEEQRKFLNELARHRTPVVLLSFGNPYVVMDLQRQPEAYLVAYSASEASQTAAAQALFGRSGTPGRLPITIPGLYDYGAGLDLDQVALREGYPEEVGMASRVLHRVDSLMQASIARRAFPGAAVAIGRGDVLARLEGYGYFTYDARRPVTPDAVYDLASLTKAVATTTAAMQLYEAGRLELDAPVARYLPAFAQNGKVRVTLRDLLTHTSGLRGYRAFHREGLSTRAAVLDAILSDSLLSEPGAEARYSDLGMITLALVIEEITDQDFAAYAETHIFEPLGMTRTGFRPTARTDPNVVPTEYDAAFRGRLIQGDVHDETAWILGGTAGHAGLFSTARDLAQFAHMLVNEGRVHGRPFLKPETIRLFTTAAAPGRHTRALGWDTKSPRGYSSAGRFFGPRSYGHTGFTGTSLWIDPDQNLFVILLSNRVHPSRENRGHVAVRAELADLAYQALQGEAEPLLPGQR